MLQHKPTVPEVAAKAGRDPEAIRRWIRPDRLPARQVGPRHVIEEEDLEYRLLSPSPHSPRSEGAEAVQAAAAPVERRGLGRAGRPVPPAHQAVGEIRGRASEVVAMGSVICPLLVRVALGT
jgi:hypothetical protein